MTSTMPVREALGRLITEQAIEALPNRTMRVPPVTLARIDDLLRRPHPDRGRGGGACHTTDDTGTEIATAHEIMAEWEDLRLGGNPATVDREVTLNQIFHFDHLSRLRLGGADPDDRKPLAAIGPLHPRRDLRLFRSRGTRRGALPSQPCSMPWRRVTAAGARAALVADISRPFAFLREKHATDAREASA